MLKSETKISKKRKNVELVNENGDFYEVNVKLLAPADIKSFELFIQQFSDQGYTVENAAVRQGTLVRPADDPWGSPEGISKICSFLDAIIPSWYETFETMKVLPLTEAEVEPFIFQMLAPAILMAKHEYHLVPKHESVVPIHDVLAVAQRIRTNSRPSSTVSKEEESDLNPGEVHRDIDTLNEKDILEVYFALEYWLKTMDGRKGRVEFSVKRANGSTLLHVEAKKGDPSDGIFQCAAYMVMTAENERVEGMPYTLWGAVTNHKTWYFLKMTDKRIQVAGEYHVYLEPGVFSPIVATIYAYLFDILGVDPKIPFDDVAAYKNEKVLAFSQKLMRPFREGK